MSGHNKWSQIKHQKGAKDAKKSALFTKLLRAVSAAARENPKPEENPRLRTLIEKAKAANIPKDTVERALRHATEEKEILSLVFECIGPHGSLIIAEGATDSIARSLQELRTLVGKYGGRPADPGSTLWAFTGERAARFPEKWSEEQCQSLKGLIAALEMRDDITAVFTNIICSSSE